MCKEFCKNHIDSLCACDISFVTSQARSAYQMGRHVEAAAAVRSAKAFNRWAIIVNVLILIFVLLLQLTWIIPVAVALANGEKEDNHDYD